MLAYSFGIFAPLFTIPQIMDIYTHRAVEGLSLLTWSGYLVFSAFWFAYSVYHRDRPLIIVHFTWALMQVMVLVGILLYR